METYLLEIRQAFLSSLSSFSVGKTAIHPGSWAKRTIDKYFPYHSSQFILIFQVSSIFHKIIALGDWILLINLLNWTLFPTIIFTECLQVSFSHKRNFCEIWKAEMENILFYTLKVRAVPSAFALHIMTALLALLLVLGQQLVGSFSRMAKSTSAPESWARHVWSSIIKGTSLSSAMDRNLDSASGCSLAWKEWWPEVWI